MTKSNQRAVILTGHFAVQKRRANILWLSDELQANGWHVTIVTTGYSWISKFRGDRRFKSLYSQPVAGRTDLGDTLANVFYYAPIHPFSLRNKYLDWTISPLHKLFAAFWKRYLKSQLDDADLVVVESGPPIMLAAHVAKFAKSARLVYRVSDDIELLGLPKIVRVAEERYARFFDRISVASPVLAAKFDGHSTVAIDPIGIPKKLYDRHLPDPFCVDRAEKEAVCVGTTQIDLQAAISMANLRPNWRFHVLGRLKHAVPDNAPGNLVCHGELPFEQCAAFIKHADIGLALYIDREGVEYQTAQSNRILQYRHFRLPIIGPSRLCDPAIPSIIGYASLDPGVLEVALKQAETYQSRSLDPVPDWHDLYLRIVSTRKRVPATA